MTSRPGSGLRVVRFGDVLPYPKCSLFLRGMARAFDLCVALGLWRLLGSGGAVAALLFLSLADGLFQGQSLGKRLFGIRVLFLPTRQSGRYRESVLRNAPFCLVVLFGMLPSPLGGAAAVGGALLIGGAEAFRVYRDPDGLRFGDQWAQTQVIDGKVATGEKVGAPAASAERAPGRLMAAS